MGLIQLDLRPSPRTLRQFGLICLIMLSIIGLLLVRRFGAPISAGIALAAIGLILFLVGQICPKAIWPFYAGLMLAGFPIGWAISHLVMILFSSWITRLDLCFVCWGRLLCIVGLIKMLVVLDICGGFGETLFQTFNQQDPLCPMLRKMSFSSRRAETPSYRVEFGILKHNKNGGCSSISVLGLIILLSGTTVAPFCIRCLRAAAIMDENNICYGYILLRSCRFMAQGFRWPIGGCVRF